MQCKHTTYVSGIQRRVIRHRGEASVVFCSAFPPFEHAWGHVGEVLAVSAMVWTPWGREGEPFPSRRSFRPPGDPANV